MEGIIWEWQRSLSWLTMPRIQLILTLFMKKDKKKYDALPKM